MFQRVGATAQKAFLLDPNNWSVLSNGICRRLSLPAQVGRANLSGTIHIIIYEL